MAFVHQNNLIHCDLSESNVLFCMDGDKIFVGVSDWGLASSIAYPPNSAYEEDDKHAVKKTKAQKDLGRSSIIFCERKSECTETQFTN